MFESLDVRMVEEGRGFPNVTVCAGQLLIVEARPDEQVPRIKVKARHLGSGCASMC